MYNEYKHLVRKKRIADCKALLEQGKTVDEIAAAMGVGASYIRQIAYHDLGVSLKKPKPPKPPKPPKALKGYRTKTDRNEEICAKYAAGTHSCGTLATEYNITRERVCQILRKANLIELRVERNRMAKEQIAVEATAYKANLEETLNRAVDLVRTGNSLNEAARQTGVGLHIIGLRCKALGVKTNHGRWRSYESRKLRYLDLRSQGYTVNDCVKIMRSEGEKININWIARYCNDGKKMYRHEPSEHGLQLEEYPT